jgi:dihydroorotate dehydrogenase electron transfer subunit
VVEATDDGSRGRRGLVTELVAGTCDETTAVFACGSQPDAGRPGRMPPRPAPAPAPGRGLLEAPMGCGFGTCLGCALPLAGDHGTVWGLCCRQGPVMEVAEVDWPGLLALPPAHVA